jgi:hypothetical protein
MSIDVDRPSFLELWLYIIVPKLVWAGKGDSRAVDERRYEHERVIASPTPLVMNQWVYHAGSLETLLHVISYIYQAPPINVALPGYSDLGDAGIFPRGTPPSPSQGC